VVDAPGPGSDPRERNGDVEVIVSGTKELAAPRERVWSVINEPAEMARLIPGVESFEITDETHWTAKVKVPLGLGGLKMTMNFEKLEERAPEFASMRAKGQGVGALMDMKTSFTLSEAGQGTSMAWEADVKIAGPVGAMGQRVLQPIVNQQVTQVLEALEKRVEATSSSAA
jgi:carbon monoxide dehydrogenase subunit G